MWQRALIATMQLVVISTIVHALLSSMTVAIVEADRSWWTDLGGTKGLFVTISPYVRRVFDIAITFLVIRWTLRSAVDLVPVPKRSKSDRHHKDVGSGRADSAS